MSPEAIIKGRIAEHLIELLLEESGYKVIRIGQEGLLVNVARGITKKLKHSGAAGKITTAPSFAVLDKKQENVFLLKIKFKGIKSRGANITHGIGQLQKYWPEALLVLVTSEHPSFTIVDESGDEVPLETIFPQIKKESLTRFEGMVKKFIENA